MPSHQLGMPVPEPRRPLSASTIAALMIVRRSPIRDQ